MFLAIGVSAAVVADNAFAVDLVIDGETGIRRVRFSGGQHDSRGAGEQFLANQPQSGSALRRTGPRQGSESAKYDGELGIAYVAAHAPKGEGSDAGIDELTQTDYASVGLLSLDRPDSLPPDSMMGVQIQRDHVRNELMLTLTGGLRTNSTLKDETPAATFRVWVFPDLATMERDTLDQGESSLFEAEVTLGRVIIARGGFSVPDFIVQDQGNGMRTARPIGSVVKVVNVPNAATAVIRLKAEADKILELPAEADSTATAEEQESESPAITMMWSPRPNPARNTVSFRFSLAHGQPATLEVYDVRGGRVAKPVDYMLDSGPHEIIWSGRDEQGNHLRSGIYFVRFEAEGERFTRRFVFLR